MRPSSATAVSSSKATTPVARLAYHIQAAELAGLMLTTMRGQAEPALGATYEEDLIRNPVRIPVAAGKMPQRHY
jgi:hypothetical protein